MFLPAKRYEIECAAGPPRSPAPAATVVGTPLGLIDVLLVGDPNAQSQSLIRASVWLHEVRFGSRPFASSQPFPATWRAAASAQPTHAYALPFDAPGHRSTPIDDRRPTYTSKSHTVHRAPASIVAAASTVALQVPSDTSNPEVAKPVGYVSAGGWQQEQHDDQGAA